MPGKTYNNYKVKWHFAPSTLTQLTASSALDTYNKLVATAANGFQAINPLLHALFPKSLPPGKLCSFRCSLDSFKALSESGSASFNTMFLTQPPLSNVKVSFELVSHGLKLDRAMMMMAGFDDDDDLALEIITDGMGWTYEWGHATGGNQQLLYSRCVKLMEPNGVTLSTLLSFYPILNHVCQQFHARWWVRTFVYGGSGHGLDPNESDEASEEADNGSEDDGSIEDDDSNSDELSDDADEEAVGD
jgi:hypothetical protein